MGVGISLSQTASPLNQRQFNPVKYFATNLVYRFTLRVTGIINGKKLEIKRGHGNFTITSFSENFSGLPFDPRYYFSP